MEAVQGISAKRSALVCEISYVNALPGGVYKALVSLYRKSPWYHLGYNEEQWDGKGPDGILHLVLATVTNPGNGKGTRFHS